MPATIDWTTYRAILFDLDGVVTPTAEVHQRAWAELFSPWAFSPADYLTYVDGKPRYDGVSDFLTSRGVELDWGDPSDPPTRETICGMGNQKNLMFNQLLTRDGVSPYPGTIAVLDLLDENQIPKAIVSSSRNARSVLEAAGMTDRFSIIVDGVTADVERLAGKPDPAMFLRAADLLSVAPSQTVVVEDASSGVEAGVGGGFALVVGVDRGNNAEALRSAGAHLVVNDLADTLEDRLQ